METAIDAGGYVTELSPEQLDTLAGDEKPAEPTAQPAEPAKAEPETAAAQESAKPQEQARDDKGRFTIPPDVQAKIDQRIDKEVAKRGEAERRAEALERELSELRTGKPAEAPKPSAKPNRDDFQTTEDFLEALTDWKADQKWEAKAAEARQRAEQHRAQTAQHEVLSRAGQKLDVGREKHADFDQVVPSDLFLSPAMIEFIGDSEHGHEVVYALGKDSVEYQRILKLSPREQDRALARLEAKILNPPQPPAPEPPQPIVSAAPDPISPVSTANSGGGEPEAIVNGNLNPAWEKWQEERDARRR